MRLRSGRVKGEVAVSVSRKRVASNKTSHSSHKIKKNHQRQQIQKVLKRAEIKKIIDESSKLRVKLNRMDTRNTVNEKSIQPRGVVNSENSNRTTNSDNDDENDGARGLDSHTIQQALSAPLPEYDERDDSEQQQQQIQAQPLHTQAAHTQPARTKKMSELLARPTKLRTEGNLAENWKQFRRQLDIFMIASEFSTKSHEIRIAVLLNIIGQDAIDLFDTFDLTDEQKQSYDEVLKSFDTFCKPKKNELYERYMFNKREQKEGESFDSFLMDIKRLARTCGYNDKEEEMLRDRIVFGIFKGKLRTKLLETQNLTYATAVEKCRSDEATNGFANDMNKAASVDEVRRDNNTQSAQQQKHQQQQQQQHQSKQNKGRSNGQRQQKQQHHQNSNASQNSGNKNNNNSKSIENCRRCTYTHKINECPAYGKKCNRCSRLNHFSNACRERKMDTIAASESENECKEYRVNFDDEFSIDTIVNDRIETDDAVVYPWREKIDVNDKSVSFKIDSGAQIDVLPLGMLKQINNRRELLDTDIRLRGFGGNCVRPKGMCSLSLRYGNVTLIRKVAIVEHDTTPILGFYTCVAFGIIKLPKNKSRSVDTINNDL